MIKNSLDVKDVKKILKEACFYGYKKSILYWLEVLKQKDTQKMDKIDKKIKILKS